MTNLPSNTPQVDPIDLVIDYVGREILDAMTESYVTVIDFDAKIAAANRKFCNLLGFREEDLVGRAIPFHDQKPAETTSRLLDLFLDRGTNRFEAIKLATARDHWITADIQVSLFRAIDKQPLGALFQFFPRLKRRKEDKEDKVGKASADVSAAEASAMPAASIAEGPPPSAEKKYELVLLNQIRQAITQDLPLSSLLEAPLSSVHRLIDHHFCGILVIDRERPRMILSSPLRFDQETLLSIARVVTDKGGKLSSHMPTLSEIKITVHKEQRRPPKLSDGGVDRLPGAAWLQQAVQEEGEPVAFLFIVRLDGRDFAKPDQSLFTLLARELTGAVDVLRGHRRSQRKRLELLAQLVPYAVIHFNSDYQVDFLNPIAMETIDHGFDTSSMHLSEVFHRAGINLFDPRIDWEQPISQTETSVRGITHEAYIVTLRAAGQQPVGGFVVLREKASVEQQQDVPPGLMQVISTELRWPLAAARESLTVAMEPGAEGSKPGRLMEALKGIDRTETILDELMELSTITSEAMRFSRTRIQPVALLEEIASEVHAEAQSLGLRLRIEFEAGVPETYADFDKIRRALASLVRIAMEARGKNHIIRLNCYGEKGEIHFIVSCPEPGRLAAAKAAGSGRDLPVGVAGLDIESLGVGVSIAKRLIDLHGGTLRAEEQKRGEATFHVTLPILKEEAILQHEIERELFRIRRYKSALSLILVELVPPKSMLEFGKDLIEEFRPVIMEKIRSIVRRPTDLVYQHSNGRLTAIIVETNRKGANALVRRIKAGFSGEQVMLSNRPYSIRLRTGLACFPEEVEGAKELIQKAEKTLRKKTVLLLSKRSELFNDLEVRLARENFEVIATTDGNAAVKRAREQKPDLLITELDTPGMSGYEVIGVLKMTPDTSEIPVLIFSSLDAEKAILESISAEEIPSIPQAAGLVTLLEKVDGLL